MDKNQRLNEYIDFLKRKVEIAQETGLNIEVGLVKFNDGTQLKPHQRDAINWAIKGGRRALFESFGLGKTIQQLLICDTITREESGKALIVCPLGVRQEFKKDAENKLGVSLTYVRNMEEVEACNDRIMITNYERVRDGNIDPKYFTVTSLDEASVLRSYGSKTYQTFLDKFKGVRFKFVCTATPSPNKYKELIHYAGYLEVMDTGQALTRFFQRDSTKANNLKIYPHKEKEFWFWMSTWALFITKPSDLGYDDTGYDLPKMEVIYHEVQVNHKTAGSEDDGQAKMFRDAALGLKDAAKEKRESIPLRVEKIRELLINYLSNDFGRKEGLPEGILREEQRVTSYEAEGEKQVKLLNEQRKTSREEQEMGFGKQGSDGGFTEKTQAISKLERIQEKTLSNEQIKKQDSNEREQTEEGIRNYTGSVQQDVARSERKMLDMQSNSGGSISKQGRKFSGRSLPQDNESKRSTVSPLQCSIGATSRQRNIAGKGDKVSDQLIIWCDLNDEQKAIEKMLSEVGLSFISLHGSTDPDVREKEIDRWKNKEVSVFLSKPEMYGSGVNLQQCNKMIFAGIGYEFNTFIQAIHRIYRFLQAFPVEIHILYAESEGEILKALLRKWKQHEYLVDQMTSIIKESGLSSTSIEQKLLRSLGIERQEVKGKNFTSVLNDTVLEHMNMPDNSVDLVVTSIPFANHYEYTPSYNDFGHTKSNDHFWEQMDFLTPELLRVLKPGRIAAIHVKDRILFGNATGDGMPTCDYFHEETALHFKKHGFRKAGMITIETDVVRENNQTYRLGWTEQCKDGTKMGVGCSEYVYLFRKLPSDTSKAYADVPVTKTKQEYPRGRWQIDARAKWNSSGDRFLTPDELRQMDIKQINRYFSEYAKSNVYDFGLHVDVARLLEQMDKLPATFETLRIPARSVWVWSDINRMITLNNKQTQKKLQNHICPLQFDIVDRLIERYSNKGELVDDPFGGIGTVPYRALQLGRKGYGSELNPDYWKDGLSYLRAAEMEAHTPTLFDLLKIEKEIEE